MQQKFISTQTARHILVMCCLLFSINSWSQIYEAWSRRYNDPASIEDMAQSLAVDASGNVFITGRSVYNLGNGQFTSDIVTIKYDKNGNQLWTRTFNGPYNNWDEPVDMVVDAQGNSYVTGASRSANMDDIITIKYSSNGTQLWASRYDGPKHVNDWASALALDAAGNVYVAGQRDANEGYSYADVTTIKYNSQGVQQWVQSYAGAANKEDAAKAIVVQNGFVYVTGQMIETGSNQDCITLKYNTAGALQWIRNFDGPNHFDDFASDVAVDASGNVYIAGSTMNYLTTFWDFLIVKYDANGNQKWYKSIDKTDNDHAERIVVDHANSIVVAGDGGGGIDKPRGAYYTFKLAPDATVYWDRLFDPGNCLSGFGDMTLDNDDNVYVTGFNKRDNCTRKYFATVKYYANGSPDWTKYYTGPGEVSRGKSIAVDSKDRVYVLGQSLEGAEGPNESGDWSFATVKYTKCLIVPPANITVNNEQGKCGAIVNYPEATTTGDCGTLTYSKASGTFFGVGNTIVTVSSAHSGESASFILTVKDTELPVITCPAPVTVGCAADIPPVNTNAVIATDNCGTPTITHVSDVISNKTCANRFTLTRTYKATDASGNSSTCEQIITVNDVTPPQIVGLSLSKYSLWPPNHTMRDITVNYTVIDNCVSAPPVTITITSNEPENGTGDGDATPDWQIVDLHHIKLRAERAGNSDGRIYTITVTVNDGCNPPVSQSQQVVVAHNTTAARGGEKESVEINIVAKLEVIAYPNPTDRFFSATIKSNDLVEKATMFVYDQQGRLMEKRENLSAGSIISFGNEYKPGIYYLRIVQGKKQAEVKLVKLNR